MMKYVLGILAAFAVIVLFIILIFGGNRGDDKVSTDKPRTFTISDYETDGAKVRLTIDGRIIDKEDHYIVQMSVGPGIRTLDVMKGYDGTVERSVAYDNTSAAYASFVRSIDKSGYLKKTSNAASFQDERGYCPMGYRYVYELLDSDNKPVSRLWNTSCGGGVGSFAGRGATIRQIFQSQFPDYTTQLKGIKL